MADNLSPSLDLAYDDVDVQDVSKLKLDSGDYGEDDCESRISLSNAILLL